MSRRTRTAEMFIAFVTVSVSGLFLWDARRYAPSPFEPIGSGAVPGGVAAAGLALGGVMLAQAVRGWRSTAAGEARPELGLRVLAAFILTAAYAAILATGWVRYSYATAFFFLAGVLVIAEQPRRLLPWAAGLAALLGFGLDYVFRTIFVTNIP